LNIAGAITGIGVTAVLFPVIALLPFPMSIDISIAAILFAFDIYLFLAAINVVYEREEREVVRSTPVQLLREKTLSALRERAYSQKGLLYEFRALCAERVALIYRKQGNPSALSALLPENSMCRLLLENRIMERKGDVPVAMEKGKFIEVVEKITSELESLR